MTVVYLDRVLALNLAVDYLLLMTTATLAGTPLRRLRFGICAACGAVYAAAVFLLPVLAHPLCRVGAGTVMALLAFRREVRPWRLTALFWLLSGGLAGLLLALGLLSGAPYGLVSRVSYADIDVVVGGRRCRLRALRDNGNTLRDPIRGQPVLVAEAAALRRLWPAETAEILGRAVPPEEKMALLHRAGVDIPFVLLPFRAVGTEGGLLLACRSDYVQIGRRSVMHTLVALTDTQVGAGGYQALWGGREKGDSHDTVAAACTMDPTAGQAG